MEFSNIKIVYTSFTGTTEKVVNALCDGSNAKIDHYPLIDKSIAVDEDVIFDENDIVIFGVPVFAGRVPSICVDRLKKFKGNKTLAIAVVVYGNRDYEDALLELQNILIENNFVVICAGAFIGQHSIFPKIASNRPDDRDIENIHEFGNKAYDMIKNFNIESLQNIRIKVKGEYPYKKIENKPMPIKISTDKKCNVCGKCASVCPVNAISVSDHVMTDNHICIHCGACIAVCPMQARKYSGILYFLASKKFGKMCATRKENEWFFEKN